MKRKFLGWLLGCGLVLTGYAQPNQLFIIGVKHKGSKALNHRDLKALLEQVGPDVVLLEEDSNTYTDGKLHKIFGEKTAAFLGIWKIDVERRATRLYIDKKPGLYVGAFDMVIPARNQYVNYQTQMEAGFDQALRQLFADGLLKGTDSLYYNHYRTLNTKVLDAIDSSLAVLNRETLMDTVRQVMSLENTQIREWSNRYAQLENYRIWFNGSCDFWELRNQRMCANIADILVNRKGQKIVVLTGMMHKYFLTDFFKNNKWANQVTVVGWPFLP
ncbi:MAG: hypothetical protein EAZ62_04600 [Sphingobacteriia bacterium]|nr:MAG: hypothetical protein EAZ62_04600 [Sphingobacteriia bacterium]